MRWLQVKRQLSPRLSSTQQRPPNPTNLRLASKASRHVLLNGFRLNPAAKTSWKEPVAPRTSPTWVLAVKNYRHTWMNGLDARDKRTAHARMTAGYVQVPVGGRLSNVTTYNFYLALPNNAVASGMQIQLVTALVLSESFCFLGFNLSRSSCALAKLPLLWLAASMALTYFLVRQRLVMPERQRWRLRSSLGSLGPSLRPASSDSGPVGSWRGVSHRDCWDHCKGQWGGDICSFLLRSDETKWSLNLSRML